MTDNPTTVTTTGLRADLTGHLMRARDGETIYVTVHGFPVAALVPVQMAGMGADQSTGPGRAS